MKRILVLSDSHSGTSFMRWCVDHVKPDAIVHLGDYFDDGWLIHEEYPGIRFYQVPGNCDRYRCPPWVHARLCYSVGGVRLFMTHGHKHSVKSYLGALLKDARTAKVDAALYGHTHVADCHQEADGIWVLNPGSCGSWGGSVGLIEVENGRILSCRTLRLADVEEYV